MEKTWQLQINAPEDAFDRLEALLAAESPAGWQEDKAADRDVFTIYNESRNRLEEIAKAAQTITPTVETKLLEVSQQDWRTAWREYFTPVEAGTRFVILPPWLAHLEHSKRQEIIIDPKNAFGTGHHASTVLCLEALAKLLDEKRIGKRDWFLDLGCGSGILGIAAAKAGLSGTGIDIDPDAIANSRENRELNETPALELLLGDISKVKREKYNLVMANILAQPLIDMAPLVTGCLKKQGCLILGGILATQAETVTAAYCECGLGQPEIFTQEDWVALLWE